MNLRVSCRVVSCHSLRATHTCRVVSCVVWVPIGVLLGVEVVQRALEVKGARPIPGEEEDEGRVPHEETVVERSVDEVGHEAVLRPRRLDVTKGLVVQE